MLKLISFIFLISASPSFAKVTVKKLWTLKSHTETPESAYYHKDTKTIFVSNVAGGALDKDGKGWISQISTEGKVIHAKWADKLNAPKGIRAHKGKLWLSDLDRVLVYDIKTRKLMHSYPFPKAKLLNDVAIAKNGDVYVSDTITGTIHRIRGKKSSVWMSGEQLQLPNGLLVVEPYLKVGGWGNKMQDDFSTKKPGSLYNINIKTKKITQISKRFGNLDGLEVAKPFGGYFVTDWLSGKLFHVDKSPKPNLLVDKLEGAADIAYIPSLKMIVVPEMKKNLVHAYKVEIVK